MINSRIIDEIFDTSSCQNYILSIQCSLNGFSFLLFDTLTRRFIAQIERELVLATPYELKNEIENELKNESILNHSFKKVKILFHNRRSVLVPNQFIIENELSTLFESSFEKEKDEQILLNEVISGVSSIVFSVPGIVYRTFIEKYSNCEFIASPLPIIKIGLRASANKGQPVFLIARFSNLLIITFGYDQKIHFLNQFYIKNDADAIYYILNAASQLNLTQKSIIQLTGHINPQSELVATLQHYFEKVDYSKTDIRYFVSRGLQSNNEHFFHPQYELTLCE